MKDPMSGKKVLAFIGDSLTQWCDWQKRFPEYQVINLGISGETVEGLLARRERIRSQTEDADCMFLMTGINNIANEHYEILAPYQEIVRNLTTWRKTAKIVVQSILPVSLTWISNDVIRNTNRHLEQIAREQGADYLDVYSSFEGADGAPRNGYLSDDGVHIADKGYDAWAAQVSRYLQNMR
jgi:lysophospholipase L1-like esterase